MTNFSEMSGLKQWGVVVAGAALLTVALYFTMFKSQREANEAAQQALDNKVRENAELELGSVGKACREPAPAQCVAQRAVDFVLVLLHPECLPRAVFFPRSVRLLIVAAKLNGAGKSCTIALSSPLFKTPTSVEQWLTRTSCTG